MTVVSQDTPVQPVADADAMKIWMLSAKTDLPVGDNPWPEYEDGRERVLVLSAPNEKWARGLASGWTATQFIGTKFVAPWIVSRGVV